MARGSIMFGFEEIVSYRHGRPHLGEKIRVDCTPQMAVDRLCQRDALVWQPRWCQPRL